MVARRVSQSADLVASAARNLSPHRGGLVAGDRRRRHRFQPAGILVNTKTLSPHARARRRAKHARPDRQNSPSLPEFRKSPISATAKRSWRHATFSKPKKPALFLLHLGDLDSEQHRTGAFSSEARATLELEDELLGYLLEVLPPRTYVAVVSDHGFETQEFVLRPNVLLADAGIEAEADVAEGLIGVRDAAAADYFRSLLARRGSALAREVTLEEVRSLADAVPEGWLAAFETVSGVFPDPAVEGPPVSLGDRRGHHGLWPTRAGYRASFVLCGAGVKAKVLPEISMLDLAPTFADLLGLDLGQVEGKSLWNRLR